MKNTKEKNTENEPITTKLRYSVSRQNFFKRLAVLLVALAAVLVLISGWGFWHELDMNFVYLQLLLPIVGCALFVVVVNNVGEKGFSLIIIPVMLDAAYIVVTEADKAAALHSILTIAICVIVTLSFILTVFGAIGSKWMMVPIILLPLAYRIIVEDLDMFTKAGFELDAAFLKELAILCMIFALLFTVFAMKKRVPAKKEKPIEEVLVELEDAEALASEDTIEPKPDAVPLSEADTVEMR